MNQKEIVSVDPDVMSGTPVFAGTRVPVESLFAHLKAGDTLADFLEGFPSVRREQAEDFLEFALKAALGDRARSNRLADTAPLVPQVNQVLETCQPGKIMEIKL